VLDKSVEHQLNTTCVTLASLRHGDRALIVSVEPGDAKLGAKLAARGLIPGVEVGVLRAGDPLLLAIDEARWAITRRDADSITVDLIPSPKKSLLQRLMSR
jgi:Fe2+ transport system protein FeoA